MPRKPRQKRIYRLTMRLTETEYRELLAGAKRLQMSDAGYARYLVTKIGHETIDVVQETSRQVGLLRTELNGMGNNLNQSMRAFWTANKNQNRDAVEKTINELWKVVLSIKHAANNLWEKIAPTGVPKRRKDNATK